MNRALVHAAFALLPVLAASCSKAPVPAPSYTIRAQIEGVVPEAIDVLSFTLVPDPSERFMMVPDGSYEGGAITTHVSARGELVIRVSGDHVRARSRTSGANLLYDLLVYPTMMGGTRRPTLEIAVLQTRFGSDQTIAAGSTSLPWPLIVGMMSMPVRTVCRPASMAACMNMGTAPGDAGPG